MFGISLERDQDQPLSRQIYQALRAAILSGRLLSATPLPSSRELSAQLTVSRNTVIEAYEMLLAEGFITARQGAPTRVAADIQLSTPHLPPQRVLSEFSPRSYRFDFRTGQPELRGFPRPAWNRALSRAAAELPLERLGYTGPDGSPRLRAEIAAWLFRSRGLQVSPEDVFITAGATHALHLLADLLCSDGRAILIEDPCHLGMLRALQSKGCPVVPLPVDRDGLQTDHLQDSQNAGLLYVTPSHQFPLGGILPAPRRSALLRFASQNNLYVVEDDYDSEFRYSGPPVAPLYAYDPQRVIYVGTFSKVLFPGLRIGYILLPPALREPWRFLRTHTDVQNPPFEQEALAEFIHTRALERHIQRMRRVYAQRRTALLSALREAFGTDCLPWGDAAGLHLAVQFPGRTFGPDFVAACQSHSLRAVPLEHHAIQKGRHLDKLLLGYGHLEPEEIKEGILWLKEVIHF